MGRKFPTFRHVLQKQLAEDGSGDTFEFEFVDGRISSPPGPGVDLFYDPPYYCWWRSGAGLDDLWKPRDWLKQHVKQNGPYDGVIMFSQGCTLGSSLLLDHFKETPNDPPPFKFAIFICGGPSLKQLEGEFGFTIAPELWDIDAAGIKSLAKRADSSAILAQGSNRWQNDLAHVTDLPREELVKMVSGPYRINIPTVHIVGVNDPRNLAGHQLHEISHPDARKIYEHPGGHDIPRKQDTSVAICRLIRWVSSPLTAAKIEQANGA
ncbi:hypothetical protein UA08_01745 [Talaromyces atroroseus]|uniref:Serine hydrolase domain-containing protein n=1 Tax=Talaromyces atroroseus TaxID=1441469 RepID=A0A1Q5QAC8_TALAT|nr:hypothetical protein UA08_01745 [Talaromyces atroroseus]OKL62885.1 hypothetical protein UA08_01745 [Talaromyces atroroseus]